MNKLIYLSNGQQAELVSELPNGKFLVDPIVSYQDEHTSEWFDIPSTGLITVDKIFTKPPTAKISTELKELQDKLYEERKKLNEVTKEYNDLSFKLKREAKEAEDLSKWKIDLSRFKCAKEVAFFLPDGYVPITLKQPNYLSDRDVKILFKASVYDAKHSDWKVSVSFKGDDRYWTEKEIDEDYGFMYDLSNDELEAITIERISKMDFTSSVYTSELNKVPEKYRTAAWHERNIHLSKKETENRIASLQKQKEEAELKIKEQQEKLKTIS